MSLESSADTRVVELTPSATVAVRVQQPFADLDIGALFDIHIPNIADRLADLGGDAAGAPYARYHEFGPERADIEIGIPVAAPVANLRDIGEGTPGEICNAELPGGEVAATVHLGSYDGLAETYRRLRDWIKAQGRQDGAGPWESYVTDPSEVSDPAQLRTEIFWPLA
jgi:effector-binding domain-containing protein